MAVEILVMLHSEALTTRILLAAAAQCSKSPLKPFPATKERPAVLQVICTRVEATDYGLVRLLLGENGRPPAVAVRQEMILGVLESASQASIGFLSD